MTAADTDLRMRAWYALDREQRVAAIRRLAADGYTDHGISHATGLSVEQVRQALGPDDHGVER